MDKDLRVELPLWTIGLLVLMMFFTYHAVEFWNLVFFQFDVFIAETGAFNWKLPTFSWLGISMVSFILFYGIFFVRFKAHNRKSPNKKLLFFSFFRPGELLDDDEMLQQVSKNVTQKIYILYSSVLPVLVLLMFFPLHRFVFIFAIFTILIAQYAMVYWDMKKFFNGRYQFKEIPHIRKANVYVWRGFIIILALLLFLGVGRIVQVHTNSKDLLTNMEECMDKGGTAIVEGGTFWTLSKFSCEKSN
ncbi:hypothetical protein [Bacillus sp. THAF10]|uniref:hypothetical protein n=1 Tax=Bacillus sp. THAF10 TaxID=2587848 RepID=UPI001268B6C6|nr:hypothetical protein [Bacillus sp. THAF10]